MSNYFNVINTNGMLPGIIDNQMTTVINGRNYEYPKSVKVDIFDPLGRASVIEENLKLVFRKLNIKGVNCLFSVVSSQNTMYMDQINELVLYINERHALTNKERFRLDRNNTDADLEVIADFFIRTLDVACFYKI